MHTSMHASMHRLGQKTKIVATIGPASDSLEKLRELIVAGMDVTRINFSHGTPEYHASLIAKIRQAAKDCEARVSILGDLPGPKMRIGAIANEPIELVVGQPFALTTESIVGCETRVSVNFGGLPGVVKKGDQLCLNDGFILLEVLSVDGPNVHCVVQVGGELRSNKGLNIPGGDLGISAFTPEDHAWLKFAASHGVDAVSQSFVSSAEDILSLRKAAAELDYDPFVVAKIERAIVLDKIDEVLAVSDGVMVARGDLGVEIPIERIAVVQKQITSQANRLGKPVITATQMLESMVRFPRPTRAEATDVANAILGGTDCIMLSEESAMGRFPVESVKMLAKIATEVEPECVPPPLGQFSGLLNGDARGLIATSVYHTIEHGSPVILAIPTSTGQMAREIARFRPQVWIVAFSTCEKICQALQFSYGVYPALIHSIPDNWSSFVREWLGDRDVHSGLAVLTQGPNPRDPNANNRLEIIDLDCQ